MKIRDERRARCESPAPPGLLLPLARSRTRVLRVRFASRSVWCLVPPKTLAPARGACPSSPPGRPPKSVPSREPLPRPSELEPFLRMPYLARMSAAVLTLGATGYVPEPPDPEVPKSAARSASSPFDPDCAILGPRHPRIPAPRRRGTPGPNNAARSGILRGAGRLEPAPRRPAPALATLVHASRVSSVVRWSSRGEAKREIRSRLVVRRRSRPCRPRAPRRPCAP